MKRMILFNDEPAPLRRKAKEFTRPPLGKTEYYDIEHLREIFAEEIDRADTYRIRLIRNEPAPAYRITLLRKYAEIHYKENKNGTKSPLQAGWYVDKSFFATRVNPLEFVINPPLVEV